MSMNRTLDAWTDTIPVYFRQDRYTGTNDTSILFAKHRLWWRFWNLKIILFRQFLLGRAVQQQKHPKRTALSDMETQCRDVAVSAASNTISSISNFLENAEITRLVTWYSMYVLI
jgi:transcriptional regulatory protein GAL4